MDPRTELAERLTKATPEQMTEFAGLLVKRAEHIQKAMDGLSAARTHYEKLADGLETMKDHIDTLHEHFSEANKAAGASVEKMVEKAVMDTVEGMKNMYAGVLTAAEGISASHDLISGALEEYETEANTVANEGLAAAQRHPGLSESNKMYRGLQGQIKDLNKTIVKMQQASERRLEQVVAGLVGGFGKLAPELVASGPIPARTAFTIEKSADGSGMTVKAAATGSGPINVQTAVSPLMPDGVTPNPEFVKSNEAQGVACEKALREIQPQVGNPFAGIEELVGAGRR